MPLILLMLLLISCDLPTGNQDEGFVPPEGEMHTTYPIDTDTMYNTWIEPSSPSGVYPGGLKLVLTLHGYDWEDPSIILWGWNAGDPSKEACDPVMMFHRDTDTLFLYPPRTEMRITSTRYYLCFDSKDCNCVPDTSNVEIYGKWCYGPYWKNDTTYVPIGGYYRIRAQAVYPGSGLIPASKEIYLEYDCR